jgi:C_GCAxxG_C_C family probable redox protein
MNEGLGGGLTEDQAVGLAAGLAIGLGESGCLCGAVSGAVLAMGLFLGQSGAHKHRREIRQAALELHALFKERHRSTCCRVLSRDVKNDASAHFKQCASLTGDGAEWAARLVLERRPHLAGQADVQYLSRREGLLTGRLKWLFRLFGF